MSKPVISAKAEALLSSSSKFLSLLEALPDALVVADEKGLIVLVNSQTEKLFGFGRSEISGQPVETLIPDRFRRKHAKHHSHYLAAGQNRSMGTGLDLIARRKDGSEFPVDISLSPLEASGSRFVIAAIRDITERKRLEYLLHEATQRKTDLLEERYRRIVETAEEGIWTTDTENRTTFVNHKLASMLGYTMEEMLGKSLYDFMDAESGRIARVSLEKRQQGISEELDFKFRHKDGSDLWAIVAANPIMEDGVYVGALAMVTDITERKKVLEKLRESEEKNRTLYESAEQRLSQTLALRSIDNAISNSLDLKFTLDIVLTQARNELKVDAADILLYNETTHVLNFFVGQGFHTTATQEAHVPLGKSYAGNVVLERKPMHLSNLSSRKTEFLESEHFPLEGFEEYHCVPLIAKGKILGVLEIFNRTVLNPTDEWVDYLETLAGQAAIAIDNITLFEGLQKANDQLVLGYDATIEGWSRALDLRDKETEGHTQRVTDLTVRLATRMGIRDEELVQVRRGALLHDIGKMGVPDNILHKPAKLTEEEWELMRQHPANAFRLLSPITYLKDALDIPYAHHEKWDGSGYPRGLAGETIPFTARLFAVIDVYDALTSDRPYRKAWSKEKALDYIKEESGIHFDPRVVKTFLEMRIAKN